jgi:cell division protein FtsB
MDGKGGGGEVKFDRDDSLTLTQVIQAQEEELTRLRAEVEECRDTIRLLYTDCESCKDKERDALREQIEELKSNQLKPGEVRAEKRPPSLCPDGSPCYRSSELVEMNE